MSNHQGFRCHLANDQVQESHHEERKREGRTTRRPLGNTPDDQQWAEPVVDSRPVTVMPNWAPDSMKLVRFVTSSALGGGITQVVDECTQPGAG